MTDYKETLRKLCSIVTVSGCEKQAHESVKADFGGVFDEIYTDRARNIILVKRSRRVTRDIKSKLLLDAHLDELGFVVSGCTDEGLLRLTAVGGIDAKILPGAEITVYGEKTMYGVISPASPGCKPENKGRHTPREYRCDIGYGKEKAAELAPIGTVCGFRYSGEELLNGKIISRGLDDKACAAALICAVANLNAEDMVCDAYVVLSSGEEIGRGGVACAAFDIHPDYALVCDVNFAKEPCTSPDESKKQGEGFMLSLSAATDRAFNRRIMSLSKEKEIPFTYTIEPTSTGTNADCIACVNEGVPAAVVGIPLGGMHSYSESIVEADADSLIRLAQALLTEGLEG